MSPINLVLMGTNDLMWRVCTLMALNVGISGMSNGDALASLLFQVPASFLVSWLMRRVFTHPASKEDE